MGDFWQPVGGVSLLILVVNVLGGIGSADRKSASAPPATQPAGSAPSQAPAPAAAPATVAATTPAVPQSAGRRDGD